VVDVDDDGLTRVVFRCPWTFRRRVEVEAEKGGLDLSKFARFALEAAIDGEVQEVLGMLDKMAAEAGLTRLEWLQEASESVVVDDATLGGVDEAAQSSGMTRREWIGEALTASAMRDAVAVQRLGDAAKHGMTVKVVRTCVHPPTARKQVGLVVKCGVCQKTLRWIG
jgi:hypothetical protein